MTYAENNLEMVSFCCAATAIGRGIYIALLKGCCKRPLVIGRAVCARKRSATAKTDGTPP
jgi:hypothetical protein